MVTQTMGIANKTNINDNYITHHGDIENLECLRLHRAEKPME